MGCIYIGEEMVCSYLWLSLVPCHSEEVRVGVTDYAVVGGRGAAEGWH